MNWSPEDVVEYCPPALSPSIQVTLGQETHMSSLPSPMTRAGPHYARYLRLLQGRGVGRVVGGGAGPRMEVPVVAAAVII